MYRNQQIIDHGLLADEHHHLSFSHSVLSVTTNLLKAITNHQVHKSYPKIRLNLTQNLLNKTKALNKVHLEFDIVDKGSIISRIIKRNFKEEVILRQQAKL